MRLARRACFAPFHVLIVLAAPVGANQICHTASTPLPTTTWSDQVVVPRFDPGLGTLDSVTLELVGHERVDASPLALAADHDRSSCGDLRDLAHYPSRPPVTRGGPSRGSLDRQAQSRDLGAQRAQQYRSSAGFQGASR